MLVDKTVQVSKEASELSDSVVKVVLEVKKALADGFQPLPDAVAIGQAVYMDLVPGLQGVEKMSDEVKESKTAFLRTWMLSGLELADGLGLV